MENATIQPEEGDLGLLESVFPGTATFDENILAPLHNNYLYEESKKCFTYSSAYLIHNTALQKRYADFRAQKREKGYSEPELEETFGFLLFDDLSKAKKVGETGLLAGQAKCTTLGDSLKGVYISKYSDCLDLKRWYDGKTGYIIIVKLTKGRIKKVTDNYTQNFTPPTVGFDSHVSEQLGAVTSTTSSFLAYERTQYYLYELTDGGTEAEPRPRQACPFAIVGFSYGAAAATSGLKKQRQRKKVFHYKPWIGQLKIESAVYDVGLQSVSGAWFPAKLPKTVQIDHAIGVSELKRTLPQEIFETCLVGEVCIDGRCFNLYDVVCSKAKNDLAQITQELKEKDLALVIPLDDSGFLILLHSSHLFSYEDARSGKAAALQGMFIFPDSRIVPRDTKYELPKRAVSTDVIQVIPALNYAETEMEKCPPDQKGAPHTTVEKHLQNYATLIQPGLVDAPSREASMFPDQYDVPSGFTLIAPKWSKDTGTQLKSYFDEPCGFTVPVVRALELLTASRQQCGDDHDDDVYYYISSPEEVPQASNDVAMEIREQTEALGDDRRGSDKPLNDVGNLEDEHKHFSVEQPQRVLPEGLDTHGTAVVTVTNSVSEHPTSTSKLGDTSTGNFVSIGTNDKRGSTEGCDEMIVTSQETPVQTSGAQLATSVEEGGTSVSKDMKDHSHPKKIMDDPDKKVDWRSLPRRRGRKRKTRWKTMQVQKEVQKTLALPTLTLPLTLAVPSTEDMMENSRKDQTESHSQSETVSNVTKPHSQSANRISQRHHLKRKGRGRRRRGVNLNLSETRKQQAPFKSTTDPTYAPAKTVHGRDVKTDSLSPSKIDWRSLPRRKRLWKSDASLKRCLRSDALKNSDIDSLSVESNNDATEWSLSSTPKKRMEGLNLKERYGLKNIVTKCGRIFVPHGSDVASEDAEPSNIQTNENMYVEMSIDTKAEVISPVENKSTKTVERRGEPPSKVAVISECEKSSDDTAKEKHVQLVSPIQIVGKHYESNPSEMVKHQHLPPKELESMTTTLNEAECLQHTNKDHSIDKTTSPSRAPDQSICTLPKVHSPEKTRKKSKRAVYSAISISKLKTVLRRGKRSSSPADGKSESCNTEPESKKEKSGVIMDLNTDNGRNKEKEPLSVNDDSRPTSLSHGSQEPIKTPLGNKEEPVSWRGLVNRASKEHGSVNVHTSAPFEIVKQADEYLISSVIGDRVRRISSDVKGSTEKLTTVATPPPDALSLLADLALGASTNKTLTDLKSKLGQESPAGVKGSPESVLHALLRYPSTKFKLPPRSPFPEGLLVTGELVLEISKEHSYSQPTSLLSGTCPQVSSPSGCVGSPLSLRAGLHLNLPVDPTTSFYSKEGGKTEWKCLISPNGPSASDSRMKTRRSRILRNRRVNEKEGSIQVVRIWRDAYEFKYDSKFTNNNLDKTVMRALHGKWNLDFEDTYEEVHVIFNMWIGLFYSKVTSRLFHLENCTALPKRKESPKQIGVPVQAPASLLSVELNLKPESPKAIHLSSEILDLSVKNSEPVNLNLVSKQNRREDTASHPVVVSPPKHAASETGLSSCPKVTAPMNHRFSVDSVRVEHSVSDNEDDAYKESDIITDCSYTQLLEGNTAYKKLCEQTSNMSISVQPHPQVSKVIDVFKNVVSSEAAAFDPKETGVSHQEICPIKTSSASNCPGLERKSLEQSCKDKTGDEVSVIQQREDESVSTENKASFEAHRTQYGRSVVFVGDGNVDQTSEFTTAAGSPVSEQKESVTETQDSKDVSDEDSQDGCLTIVEDEPLEEHKTPESSSRDQSSVAESNETPHVEEQFKLSLDLKEHTDEHDGCVDELQDGSSLETRAEEQNETVNTREELEPLLDLEDHADVADTSCMEGNDTKEPVEERDESCAVMEMMQEHQRKSEERTKLDVRDSECEIATTVVERLDESDLDLQDNVDSVDMEISDEDPDEILDEVNAPSVESFVSEPIDCESNNEDQDVKMEKSETPPTTSVVANPRDDSPKDVDQVSCSGDVSSLACQTMSVEEKTTTASKNDFSEVMQDRSENMTPERRIVVQEAALDIYDVELKSTRIVESSKLEISHSEKDDAKDLGQQHTTGNNENINKNEPQSQTYSSDNKPQETDAYQKPPQVLSQPSSLKSAAPQALAKASESEVKGTASTPTQDEVSYVPDISEGFGEVSESSEELNRNQNSSNMAQDIDPEDPGWKKNQNSDAVDFVVKDNSALPSDLSPNENPETPFRHKHWPTSQHEDQQINFTESASPNLSKPSYRDYDVDDLHGYYHDCPRDEHLLWSDCTMDGPDSQRYDEDDPFDEDFGDVNYPPIHSAYDTFEALEFSFEPKKKDMEKRYWVKKHYKSDPRSTLGDATKRADRFKCQTKVTYSPQYTSTIDIPEADQIPEKRSRSNKFTDVLSHNVEWSEEDRLSCTVDNSIRKTSHFETYATKPTRTVTDNSVSHVRGGKQQFDWRRYFTREAASRQLYDSEAEGCDKFDIPPSSIVTVLDKKGNRVIFDSTMKPSVDADRMTTGSKDSSNLWQSKVDMTQCAIDLEYLIFSEKLSHILKESKSSLSARSHFRSKATFPMTVRLSDLNELESSAEPAAQTSLTQLKIKVDLSDRKPSVRKQRHFSEDSSEEECFRISETSEQCASDRSRINDVCTKKTPRQTQAIKRKWGQDSASQQPGSSGHISKETFDVPHDNQNFIESQKCKMKYRFYILVTSADTFFEETKKLLMLEGHLPVEPDEFDLSGSNSSPLLIVLRNEDIAEHICKVPCLLELKKSSNVMFAGVDRPDDVVNLTHQELFANGGFIVCDELAFDALTLDNMRKVVGILEELGKWKWFLHYKDSRKLRESVRSSHEASKKQRFIDDCQELGIVEVLPYHDCDVISRGRADCLFCLTHLQIQNMSVRFPVFITDTPADSFERNGILTMNTCTFSQILSTDSCSVS